MDCFTLSIEGTTDSEKRYPTLEAAIVAARTIIQGAPIAVCDCIGLVAMVCINGAMVRYGETCQEMKACQVRETQ
jgi:hypothetical protein